MAGMGRHKNVLLWVLGVLFVSLAAFGCGGSGVADLATENEGSWEDSTSEPEIVEDSMPEATVGATPETSETSTGEPTSVEGDNGVVAEAEETGPEFGAASEASGGQGFGADGLLAVRHGVHEGYERVVLDLGSGQYPAERTPEWSLSTPEGDGLLRVSLPSVISTAVSDGDLGDGFLEDFHVVRAPDGGVFVDVLSSEAFTYRVLELTDPARLVVDFKSSGASPRIPPPEQGGDTVLTTPRAGERVSNPLTVSGYSRNFEARNEIILLDSSGEVVAQSNVSSNDWSSTWGYFEATLDLPEFTGSGTLRVGSQSARDGGFEGVEIPVVGIQ